jgi:hypothetical protein
MKNNTYIYLAGALLILTVACGGSDKKSELEKLKLEQATLTEKIQKLEDEIEGSSSSKSDSKSTPAISANAKYIVLKKLKNNRLYTICKYKVKLIQIKMCRLALALVAR